MKQWTQQTTGHQIEVTPQIIIFGTGKSEVLDLVIHATIMYVYRMKMSRNEPRTEGLINNLEAIRNLEKYIAINKEAKHERKWTKKRN